MTNPAELIPHMTFPRDATLRRRFELAILQGLSSNVGEFMSGLSEADQTLIFDIGRLELRDRVALAQQAAIDGSLPLYFLWNDPAISMREACDRAAALMRNQSAFSCRKTVSKAPKPRAWTERHYRALRREYAPVLHMWMAAYSIAGDSPTYDELSGAVESPLFRSLTKVTGDFVRRSMDDTIRKSERKPVFPYIENQQLFR